jgi:hypothetical protein
MNKSDKTFLGGVGRGFVEFNVCSKIRKSYLTQGILNGIFARKFTLVGSIIKKQPTNYVCIRANKHLKIFLQVYFEGKHDTCFGLCIVI